MFPFIQKEQINRKYNNHIFLVSVFYYVVLFMFSYYISYKTTVSIY